MSKEYKSGYYESEEFSEPIIISITLDDGTEQDCEVITIFPVRERQYAALLPLSPDAEDIYLYRFVPVGEAEFTLEGIETDEEYDEVSDVFEMLVDDAEFEELEDGDEL